jgi:hypothetical protein
MMGVITVNVNDFMFEQNEKESLYEKLLEFVNENGLGATQSIILFEYTLRRLKMYSSGPMFRD